MDPIVIKKPPPTYIEGYIYINKKEHRKTINEYNKLIDGPIYCFLCGKILISKVGD